MWENRRPRIQVRERKATPIKFSIFIHLHPSVAHSVALHFAELHHTFTHQVANAHNVLQYWCKILTHKTSAHLIWIELDTLMPIGISEGN